MSLDLTHKALGWPSRDQILKPSGAGPSVYAQLVQSKIGRALARRSDSQGVKIGILTGDSKANATEPPMAIVCEFPGVASEGAIEEAHWLAWNFCRAPLLITIEPHLIRSWSICERPRYPLTEQLPEAEIKELSLDPSQPVGFSAAAARSLSWISFVSGQLFREYAPRFERTQCADTTLLDNLKEVRRQLVAQGLHFEIVHDLLARLMFIQFLFHRKDKNGWAALTPNWLQKQY
jgi:hypothetical protein